MLASLARWGYLWQRGGLGVIQLKEKSISTGSKLELQRPLNVLNFFRKIVGPVSIHERFWVQTSENTPGGFPIDEQKVLRRPGELAEDVEHLWLALHSLLGGRWLTFWDFGQVLRQEIEFRLYVLTYLDVSPTSRQWCPVQANLQVASSRMSAKNQPFSTRLWSWISWCSLLAWLGLRWEVGLVA